MTLTYQNPDVYDAAQKAHRPMVPGADAVNPGVMPVSARANNRIQNLADGLYLGDQLASAVYYVNNSGSDTAAGTKAAPWRTLDGALANVVAMNNNGQYRSTTTLALQAGQAFTMSADVTVYGGLVNLAFYGDPQYGDFNSAPVGPSQADPSVMTDLQRPIINPVSSQVNAQWKLAGFNLVGGMVQLQGVQLSLPAAPASPNIALYSTSSDFVRVLNWGTGTLSLYGAQVNITDTNAYWGMMGMLARALPGSLVQFASQLRINGILIQDTTATTAQLTARNNFFKFYSDFAGNNQVLGTMSPTAQNSSPGSGLLNLMWTDTESLTVAPSRTSQATFPVLFNQNYGLRNYFMGLVRDQQQRPLNVVTSRLF